MAAKFADDAETATPHLAFDGAADFLCAIACARRAERLAKRAFGAAASS